MTIASIGDLREAARRRLPRMLFDYIDGAAYDEKTMRWNEADFDRLRLVQRPLAGIDATALAVTVLGAEQALPLVIAPAGFTGLMARRGEVQAARAAKAAGIPQCLSTVSIASVAEVKRDSGVALWFQLYVTRDRGITRDLLAQAAAAGCPVLAVTVDISAASRRERDVRNHFSLGSDRRFGDWLDMAFHPRWLLDMARSPRLSFGNLEHLPGAGRGLMSQAGFVTRHLDYTLNWRDIDWLRAEWKGKLIVKGITHPEDARRAAAAGADGLVVSNHGGRQLDTGISSIAALPGVVEAVGERLEVLMDSGIRRGSDVVKALALGAKACLIGRAFLYGLGARGEAGVAQALEILKAEIAVVLAHIGVADVRALHARRHEFLAPVT
jgi:L-lactate dehydrogenase (cytochrome)